MTLQVVGKFERLAPEMNWEKTLILVGDFVVKNPHWRLCCLKSALKTSLFESPLKTLLSRIRRQKINLAADSSLTAAAWSAISKRFFVAIFYPRFSFCPLETNDSKKISAISFWAICEFKVLQYLLSFSAFGRPRQMCCLHGGGQGRQMHKVSVRFNFFYHILVPGIFLLQICMPF